MTFCAPKSASMAKAVLPHLALIVVYFIYLLFGAIIFKILEQSAEEVNMIQYREKESQIRKDIMELMHRKNDSELEALLDELTETVSHPDFYSGRFDTIYGTEVDPWGLPSAMLFCMTTITTIGYGDVTPATPWGKAFCVMYSSIGVPMSFLLFADIGGLLAKLAVRIARYIRRTLQRIGLCKSKLGQNSKGAIKRHHEHGIENGGFQPANGSPMTNMSKTKRSPRFYKKEKCKKEEEVERSTSVLEIEENYDDVPFLAVVVLLLSYLCLGAWAFAFSEEWYYGEAFYFTFITLTTIGFGDYVPSKHYENQTYIPCMLYTLLGLCYMSMCITLLQKKFVRGINKTSEKFEALIDCCRGRNNTSDVVV